MTHIEDEEFGKVVHTFQQTRTVNIRQWPHLAPGMVAEYDWIDSTGIESDELFFTIDEAIKDSNR